MPTEGTKYPPLQDFTGQVMAIRNLLTRMGLLDNNMDFIVYNGANYKTSLRNENGIN
jgi:hypothetical protein